MIELRVVQDKLDAGWDKVVETQPGGTLFHTSAWLDVLRKTQGAELLKLGVFSGTDLIGVFPIFLKRYGIIRAAASPLVIEDTPYMGPVAPEEELKPVFDQVDDVMRKRGVHFTRVLFPRMHEGGLFEKLGYTVIPKYTHVLDLTLGAEEIWKKMEGRCRTDIRRAMKSGVAVALADRENISTPSGVV